MLLILHNLVQHKHVVGPGQRNLIVEHWEYFRSTVVSVPKKESRDTSLGLNRVGTENELHGVRLHNDLHEESATTGPADFNEGFEVDGLWHEWWLLGEYLKDFSWLGIIGIVAQEG